MPDSVEELCAEQVLFAPFQTVRKMYCIIKFIS